MSSRWSEAAPPGTPAWAELDLGSGDRVEVVGVDDDDELDAWDEVGPDGSPPTSPDSPNPNSLRFRFRWRKLWRFAGPGWLMSLAYLDPGNLESNLQQGAYTRYSIVWVLWWATVTGLILQEMSARIGLVTGRDLAQAVRDEYPRWLSFVVYAMMEIAVIGADIQEVVGSGIAFNLLSGGAIPVWAGCLITAFDTVTFLAIGWLGVRYLEAFVCGLIGVLSLCFFANSAHAGLHAWTGVFHGWLVPSVPPFAFTQVIGTVGAVIMPHNLYLHSGLVLSRRVRRTSPYRVNEAIWYARIESAGALFFAFAINLSVVVVNSAKFFSASCAQADGGPFACLSHTAYEMTNGVPDAPGSGAPPAEGRGAECAVHDARGQTVRSGLCGEIGLENAGFALADAMGSASLYVWALGLLAAGQASTMVCTYAGQIIMSGCLDVELPPWKRVALTRVLALAPALAVAVGTEASPAGFSSINEYLNILQSVQLPFAMLPALHFSASAPLLGRFSSSPLLMLVSTFLAAIILATNAYLIWNVVEALERTPLVVATAMLGSFAYAAVCARLVWDDLTAAGRRLRRVFPRALGSSATFLRYKLGQCCWFCFGSGKSDRRVPSDLTRELIDADASIEGELLGHILTPSALHAAARRADGSAAKRAPSSDTHTRPPSASTRNLARDLDRVAASGSTFAASGTLGSRAAGVGSLSIESCYSDARENSCDSLSDLSSYEPPLTPSSAPPGR